MSSRRAGGRVRVFVYGSLVDPASRCMTLGRDVPALPARLAGFRRRFGVGMRNVDVVPGYKHYVDPTTGERADIVVAFLDIASDPSTAIGGVVLVLEEADLRRLDARERSYRRVDVTRSVENRGRSGSVFAYEGTPAARARFEEGRREGTVRIARAYADGVRDAHARLGPSARADYDATTDPPDVPVIDLVRIDPPV